MALNRTNNADLMKAGLDEIFWKRWMVDPMDNIINAIFYTESHDSQFKRYMTIMGYPILEEKGEGAAYSSADPSQAYYTDLEHKAYGLYSTITYEAQNDERYDVIKQLPGSMYDAAKATVNYYASRVLTQGFTQLPTYQTGDRTSTEYLFSTSHAMKDGSTQANRPSTDVALSATSLWAAVNSFYSIKNEAGLPITVAPKSLIVPHQLQQTAHELLESNLYPETAENAINVLRTAFQIEPVIWPYWLGSVDANAWYLLGDKAVLGDHSPLHFIWREKPRTKMAVEDLTENLLYFIYCRFSCGWPTYQGIYGTSGP